MADLKYNWSVMLTKELILEYESNEMLYNTRHPDYKNRNKRQLIYRNILKKLNELQNGLDLKELKRKLNGLRSQFLNEKLKITKSKESGADSSSVYQPCAYWYPLLKFLENSTEADESISNFDEENSSNSYRDEAGSATPPNLIIEEHDTINIEAVNSGNQPPQKKRKKDEYDTLLKTATATMSQMSKLATAPVDAGDEFDFFGKFVASELRDIRGASDQICYQRLKRQIQQNILNTWESIDRTPRAHSNASIQSSSTNIFAESADDMYEEEYLDL